MTTARMNTKRIRRDRRQRSCPTTTISFSPYLWRAAATVFVWSLLLSTSLLAAAAAPRRPARGNKNSVLSNSDASTIRLSRSKIYLWRQRLIRGRLQRQFEAETAASIAATASGKTNRRGSTLTIGLPPTPERLTAWFGSCSSCSSNECDTGTTQASFNHESVGMTNPCLHVMLRQEEEDAVAATVDATKLVSVTKKTKRRTPKTVIDSSSTGGDGWWPGTIPDRYLSKTWRVLRFQRHVGQGWDCYQRVRDAALAWEFTSSDGLKGICNVPPPSNDENSQYTKPNQKRRSAFSKRFRNGPGYTVLPVTQQQQQPPKMKLPEGRYSSSNNNDEDDDGNAKDRGLGRRRAASAAVQQIWSGPGRRLITFTSIPLLPAWLSAQAKLYCFNPVHVVYDLVDQRAPPPAAPATSSVPHRHHHHHSTQYYSSTAYATGAGHWIRGEERVTVALRDNGSVEVQILSCSKPAAPVMGRLVWPVVRKMQHPFYWQQLNYLEQVAAAAVTAEQPPSESTSRRRRDPNKK